ncbi:MAG: hypothetical protein GX162_05315 [Firmicutes bacterium]|nr:hypothetical protein [Bacillota bacterium]
MSQRENSWMRWLQGNTDASSAKDAGDNLLLRGATGRGLAVLTLVGIALMVLSRGGGPSAQPTLAPPPLTEGGSVVSYEERLARELREILGHIEGAGAVEVFVALEAGEEVVIAEEVTIQRTAAGEGQGEDLHESRRPVTLRDDASRSEKPLVLLERRPKIKGVVVVAQGASSPQICYRLSLAVQTALSLPANRVAVFPMRPGDTLRR